MKPLKKHQRNLGYTGFVTMSYDPNQPPYNYRFGDYEKLSEKTYEVIRIDTFLTKFNGYVFTLKMVEDESVMCKYIYHGRELSYPFITISYYNYLCSTLIGTKYIISNFAFKEKSYEERKKESYTTSWIVTKVALDDEGTLFVVVNCGSEEERIKLDEFLGIGRNGKYGKTVYSELEWNTLVKQHGIDMMKTVLAQEIRIGMPEELVRYSWGDPEKINRSSYGEDQWCYDGQYVYMKNHKVSAWN